jgi:alkylhydroperoxidase family enzyme
MSTYRVHTIESAPEKSKSAVQDLKKAFGFVPNLIGAMAASPVLISSLVPVFRNVHTGSFSEREVQAILLTDAVTNSATWPVALHSKLALDAGVSADDVQAIRARHAPKDQKLAAISGLARAMIENRGHLEDRDLAAFRAAGYSQDLVLEVIGIVAASTITNYTASITNPPLEETLKPHAWTAEDTA